MRRALPTLGAVLAWSFVAACWGPGRLERRSLPTPNPTAWEFPVAAADVRAAVSSSLQLRPLCLGYGRVEVFFTDEVSGFECNLGETRSNTDACLSMVHGPVCISPVYVSRGQALPYRAAFHIHLVPVTESRTRVEIRAVRPQVLVGRKPQLNVHAGPILADIWVHVEPTTVEEYRVLLRIGEALGARNMPPVSVPTDS